MVGDAQVPLLRIVPVAAVPICVSRDVYPWTVPILRLCVRCTNCVDIVSLPVLSPRTHPNLTLGSPLEKRYLDRRSYFCVRYSSCTRLS
jgi:hypothetical protein